MDPILVDGYFSSCVIDVCLTDDINRTALSQAIEAFVSECQKAGVVVPLWRRQICCRKLHHGSQFFYNQNM